jgi:hypothetical protein
MRTTRSPLRPTEPPLRPRSLSLRWVLPTCSPHRIPIGSPRFHQVAPPDAVPEPPGPRFKSHSERRANSYSPAAVGESGSRTVGGRSRSLTPRSPSVRARGLSDSCRLVPPRPRRTRAPRLLAARDLDLDANAIHRVGAPLPLPVQRPAADRPAAGRVRLPAGRPSPRGSRENRGAIQIPIAKVVPTRARRRGSSNGLLSRPAATPWAASSSWWCRGGLRRAG